MATKPKNKTGRPKTQIDLEQAEETDSGVQPETGGLIPTPPLQI